VAALVLTARVVSGDLLYRSGAIDFALSRTERASALLWPWPDPVATESRIHAYQARTEKDPSEMAQGLDAARRARRLEPDNSSRSVAVAAFLGQLGRHDEAAAEYARALALNPWSRQALSRRADELTALGRLAQARACRTAAELDARSDRDLREARRACLVARPGGS
jgi:Flp pilus assembly protein TadD